ncbi:MAG: beta-phosphoglucomutase family hydrolase [Bacteroidales bacterium]|nr:beta-phosphoglucomutase family hydrolase [Bacteroidales bacterium]
MSKYGFDAVIFDLDGVITHTTLLHSAAWKKMFDNYLRKREQKYGETFREFTYANDYLQYVDGRQRYEGVKIFLQSRAIELPYGDPSDSQDKETICGLGNKKNQAFNEVLARDGVKVYDSTITLIKELKEKGIKVGVASSSRNCEKVLKAAGIIDLFETRVDGVVSAELGLKGKPEPDIFLRACNNIGVTYDRTVIVEDAVSGVQAGAKGNFGFVLGIARENNERELKINGADIVVKDIDEIGFEGIEKWFQNGLEQDSWSLNYYDYNISRERSREALLTIGNGYFGTRGAMEETNVNNINYPGTYIAGIYNRLTSLAAGREIENEDFVNCPNWLPINFKIGNDDWFDVNETEYIHFHKKLNFKNGVLFRKIIVKDKKGREVLIESKRIASMDNPHLACLSYKITPLNFSKKITVRSGLNGVIINNGVERYKKLNQKHLEPVKEGGRNETSYILFKTNNSKIEIAEYAKILVQINNKAINPDIKIKTHLGSVYSEFELDLGKTETLCIEKIVAIYTSNDQYKDPLQSAKNDINNIKDFNELQNKSENKWAEIWKEIDMEIEGDRLSQKLIRLHLYHLIVSASPHNINIDASITARGLHGEAYRGHIFWDELFILPFYNIHFYDTARSFLMYRYRRLEKAREYAKEQAYKGAMFPWQSGSDGREETQILHLNPMSGKWDKDNSSLQRHVSLAIAYNIYQYYKSTNDIEFIENYGAEMFLEICRFWSDKSIFNKKSGRYEISKVMGPDEFHEKNPGAKKGGLKDNTYTNIMVVWTLKKAFEMLNFIDPVYKNKVINKINLTNSELDKWKDIIKKINIDISKQGILAQYDGYFNLKELDWEEYKEKYGNISRMDRVLKAEGKSADDYKIAKQADTLMIFFNLEPEEVKTILNDLGYIFQNNFLKDNFKYYFKRTSHGSTLSRVVHAYIANKIVNNELSWELFKNALISDYNDTQGGTTAEGIHTGVMAGTILIALTSYAGLNLKSDIVKFHPVLPEHWRKIKFNFNFKKTHYTCNISKKRIKVKISDSKDRLVNIEVLGKKYLLNENEWKEIDLVLS